MVVSSISFASQSRALHGCLRHFAVNALPSQEVIEVTANVRIGAHIRHRFDYYLADTDEGFSGVGASQDSEGNSRHSPTCSPSSTDQVTV